MTSLAEITRTGINYIIADRSVQSLIRFCLVALCHNQPKRCQKSSQFCQCECLSLCLKRGPPTGTGMYSQPDIHSGNECVFRLTSGGLLGQLSSL